MLSLSELYVIVCNILSFNWKNDRVLLPDLRPLGMFRPISSYHSIQFLKHDSESFKSQESAEN